MATRIRIPQFKSEKAEAEWWDAHPEVITELFLRAKQKGKLRRLPPTPVATSEMPTLKMRSPTTSKALSRRPSLRRSRRIAHLIL